MRKDVKYITMGNFASGINSFSLWGANMDTEKPEPFIDTITEGLGNCDNDIIDDADDNNNYYYYPTIEVVNGDVWYYKNAYNASNWFRCFENASNLFQMNVYVY